MKVKENKDMVKLKGTTYKMNDTWVLEGAFKAKNKSQFSFREWENWVKPVKRLCCKVKQLGKSTGRRK